VRSPILPFDYGPIAEVSAHPRNQLDWKQSR
jgi:hypothetical protein